MARKVNMAAKLKAAAKKRKPRKWREDETEHRTEAKRNIDALIEFIDSRQNEPYAWGRAKNDSVSFALAAVKAMTGHDRATHLKWETKETGLRVLAKEGGYEAAFDKYFVRIPISQAVTGDIAGLPDDALGLHVGIVEGIYIVGPGEKGNKRIPRRAMIAAWSATKQKERDR